MVSQSEELLGQIAVSNASITSLIARAAELAGEHLDEDYSLNHGLESAISEMDEARNRLAFFVATAWRAES